MTGVLFFKYIFVVSFLSRFLWFSCSCASPTMLLNLSRRMRVASRLFSTASSQRPVTIRPQDRASKLFFPTLKETPADAVVASHKLLVRGGYMRQVFFGQCCSFMYIFLPSFPQPSFLGHFFIFGVHVHVVGCLLNCVYLVFTWRMCVELAFCRRYVDVASRKPNFLEHLQHCGRRTARDRLFTP